MLCLIRVCSDYYLFHIGLPLPPDAVLLGIISFDVRDEGAKVEIWTINQGVQILPVYISFENKNKK